MLKLRAQVIEHRSMALLAAMALAATVAVLFLVFSVVEDWGWAAMLCGLLIATTASLFSPRSDCRRRRRRHG